MTNIIDLPQHGEVKLLPLRPLGQLCKRTTRFAKFSGKNSRIFIFIIPEIEIFKNYVKIYLLSFLFLKLHNWSQKTKDRSHLNLLRNTFSYFFFIDFQSGFNNSGNWSSEFLEIISEPGSRENMAAAPLSGEHHATLYKEFLAAPRSQVWTKRGEEGKPHSSHILVIIVFTWFTWKSALYFTYYTAT